MQPIRNYEIEISKLINKFENMDKYKDTESRELFQNTEKTIESKLFDIIKNNSTDKLSTEFLDLVHKNFYSYRNGTEQGRVCWKLFSKINSYIHANSSDEKNTRLKEVEDLMQKTERKYVLNKGFTQAIYSSHVPEIVDLYKTIFPKPPLSIFDADKIPPSLLKENEEKNQILAEFKNRNIQDNSLEKKVLYIQRHIRAKNRKESEIKRIQKRYFEYTELPLNEVIEQIDKGMNDANTPYRPKKCSPELADRIMKASEQVTLHSTIKHLTSKEHIAAILDGCLLGRENLTNSFTPFRPAALKECDIKDGDGNVICFGPDRIDGQCSFGPTIALEFDLAKILDPSDFNINPSIFFKQLDFGYYLELNQTINLKTEVFTINQTGSLRCADPTCTHIKLLSASGEFYYSELPKYSFISYNTQEIQKIWTLNFFRYLDTLKDGECKDAPDQINYIYDLISKLSETELVEFLTDLGKKMSCTAEFNFYGAYKIDLNALQRISLNNRNAFNITIHQLCEELNSGNFNSLSKLKSEVPELLKSNRFVEFLLSKISDPAIITQVKELIKI